jgi:chromosome segregation ATPase
LRSSIANLEVTSLEKNQRIEELEKMFEAEKAAREEDLVFFRLQQMKSIDKGSTGTVVDDVRTVAELSEAKQKILLQGSELEEQRQRIEILLEQNRQYEKRMFGLESDANRYKDKLKEFEKNSGATTVLKAEQEALLNSLRRDLKNALSAKEDLARHVKDLEAYRGRAEGQLVKLVEYKEKAQLAEESLIEAQALNSRLQNQLQTVETNHALKTAMLATVEAEIDSLKEKNFKSKQEYEKKLETFGSLQQELKESNERVSVALREKEECIDSFRKEISELKEKHTSEMRESQDKATKEVQDLMKEFSKKSATASALIAEREKEIHELRLKVSSLKDEIASGSPSERRIFELAQSQANREASIGASM